MEEAAGGTPLAAKAAEERVTAAVARVTVAVARVTVAVARVTVAVAKGWKPAAEEAAGVRPSSHRNDSRRSCC